MDRISFLSDLKKNVTKCLRQQMAFNNANSGILPTFFHGLGNLGRRFGVIVKSVFSDIVPCDPRLHIISRLSLRTMTRS